MHELVKVNRITFEQVFDTTLKLGTGLDIGVKNSKQNINYFRLDKLLLQLQKIYSGLGYRGLWLSHCAHMNPIGQ